MPSRPSRWGGPDDRAMLLYNTVKAAEQQEDVEVELP